MLFGGPSKKILVDLASNYILDNGNCDLCNYACSSCAVSGCFILRKLIFVVVDCFLVNKVKNYNSLLLTKGMEKRKNFNNNIVLYV